MTIRHAMTAALLAMIAFGCGSDTTGPGAGVGAGNHLVIEGRPSSVLLELTGPGIGTITSDAYTRTVRDGDAVTVLVVGTDLEGSVGTLTLTGGASATGIAVRVVEAANAQNQVMAPGSVTGRIHVGTWQSAP